MTRKRSVPSTSAIWLLQHFVSSERREPLVGDLLEKLREERSARWFWREVLIAILFGIGPIVRAHKTEIAFAVVGTMLQEFWWRTPWWKALWQSPIIQPLYGWGVGWHFPFSTIYVFIFHSMIGTVILLVLLAVFLSVKGGWSWASILTAILISFPLLAAGHMVILLFPRAFYYMLDAIPFFFALLISTWISRCLLTSEDRQLSE